MGLPSSFFLLPSSFFLLPSSFLLPPSSFFLWPSSFFLLPSSFFLHSFLVADHPRVDHLRAVSHHLFDQSLLHQLNESPPGEGTSHLQPLRHDGGCDELVSGDLLVQLVIGAPH